MKKLLKAPTLFALMLSIIIAGNAATSNAASNDASSAYQTFVNELKTKCKPAPVYTATMKSGDGEDILLISDYAYDHEAFQAKIYQYVNNEVTYVGEVEACGDNETLYRCGNYISICTGPSESEDLIVSNGKATDYRETGLDNIRKNATVKQYTMENNKRTLVSTKQVSRKKIQSGKHFWLNGKSAKWVPIKFKKA